MQPFNYAAGFDDLDVMDRDSRKMRGKRLFYFTNLKAGDGVLDIAGFIVRLGGLPERNAATAAAE